MSRVCSQYYFDYDCMQFTISIPVSIFTQCINFSTLECLIQTIKYCMRNSWLKRIGLSGFLKKVISYF
jgi:hypothetical protein